MTQLSNVPRAGAPPLAGARGAVHWIGTNNPFYVISAGLFLAGLWISFGNQSPEEEILPEETWALMSWLAGYTLLLAGTGLLLVRFAKVWDDARTVLLLVVLMFLATSVTFDEVLVQSPNRGIACNLLGLVFAIAVSEGLLRGIRLKLPFWFRLPYYLILALFFLYPLALVPLVHEPLHEGQMWLLYAFAAVAGLLFLTLLPAIRRGAGYIADNGSPWPWPLYPWTLFGMLALAVCGRAYLLCFSMHLIEGGPRDQLIFEPFFLLPFGLACAALVLEMGLVSRRYGFIWCALAAPLVCAAVAAVSQRHDPINERFLKIFTDRIGETPLFVSLCLSVVFYGYAALRGVELATWVLVVALAALAVVRPTLAGGLYSIVAAAGLVAFGLLLRHGPSVLVAALLLACWLTSAGWQGYRFLRQMLLGLDYIAISLALFALAVFISLGKSGLLSRWLTRRREEVPVAPPS